MSEAKGLSLDLDSSFRGISHTAATDSQLWINAECNLNVDVLAV